MLATSSPTAKGATRQWRSIDDSLQVGDARVGAGIHWRFSTDVGAAMGRQVGALAVQAYYGH